jgi:hypothetical protein
VNPFDKETFPMQVKSKEVQDFITTTENAVVAELAKRGIVATVSTLSAWRDLIQVNTHHLVDVTESCGEVTFQFIGILSKKDYTSLVRASSLKGTSGGLVAKLVKGIIERLAIIAKDQAEAEEADKRKEAKKAIAQSLRQEFPDLARHIGLCGTGLQLTFSLLDENNAREILKAIDQLGPNL